MKIDIKKILKRANLNWPENEIEQLSKDFETMYERILKLPNVPMQKSKEEVYEFQEFPAINSPVVNNLKIII